MPKVTYIEAISIALRNEMRKDPNVFCIGEDIATYGGAFKVTKGFVEEFGTERIIDTPIAESAIIGASIGAAMVGMRPVAEMQFADFVTCGFNQLVNNAAKSYYRWGAKVPMVLRLPCGGGVHGGPFHSANLESWFFHTPGLKLVAPSTAYDAKGLMTSAIRDNNPVLYFEHKYLYRRPELKAEIPEDDFTVEIGKGNILREGKDAVIITYSSMVLPSLKAAETLSKEGYEVEVLDLRSLLPFDKDLILESVKKCNKVMIVHEATKTGGIGGEISAFITENAFEFLDAPISRVTSIDTPVPFSPPLEEYFMPTEKKITEALISLAEY